MVSWILLIVGGLNWLLIGLFDWGVADIFGYSSIITKIIYILVGISAVYELITHKKNCKQCGTSSSMPAQGQSM